MIDNSFHIITFGCQMNVHDSQWLARALEARGFCEAPLEEARVVVVNTCSVREKPEQKVMSTLGRIRQVTGNSPRVLVAVTGCVAQQLGEKLFSRQVRLVAGSDGISGAPQAIERLLDERILPIGAFVELAPGKDGMIHISKLENRRVEKVEDVLNIGDMTWVKVTEIDEKGRVNLSRKDALKELAAAADKK